MRRIARNLALTLGPIVVTWATMSWARTEETTPYSKTQAYNGALRFLRIEQEFEVIERDADLGYVLFQYPTGDGNDKTTGSLEIVERDDEVLVVVQIAKLPAHHESRLVGALLKKLEADYGAPPQRRAKDKTPPESEDSPDEDDPKQDDEPANPAPKNPQAK